MRTTRSLAVFLIAASLTACGGGGSGPTQTPVPVSVAQTGTVTLSFSDGIIDDYDQVLFEIAEVRFLSDAGQDILVMEEPVTVDFLALQNFSEVLLRREVVTGTFSKIRLILDRLTLVKLDDDGLVVSEDEVRLNGLRKIDVNPRGPFQVRGGEEIVIDIEIDLDKSMHVVGAGKSGNIRFRPVVFAAIDTEPAFDKLFRVEGIIDSIAAAAPGTFDVCDIRRAFADGINRPQPLDVCVTVNPEDATPYFNLEAQPVSDGFDALAVGDVVVVYGKFDQFATGDRLVAAVVASGSQFEDHRGVAASELRPDTADFDLGAATDVCEIDPAPLRVVVAEGAPAFVETPTGADPADITALPLVCRRAEVEGYFDTAIPAEPFLRTFVVLFGESLDGLVELTGVLADKAGTPATNDFDLTVTGGPAEVVEVSDATRLVRITSDSTGHVVEELTAVPLGPEVVVYGIRRESDDVIEATFILEEVAAP